MSGASAQSGAVLVPADYQLPELSAVPAGSGRDAILAGKALITKTRLLLPKHVGNGLNCSNCHLDAATRPGASSWVGIWRYFPEYRARSGKAISLQQRINDCFERSMNGTALDIDSAEMRNILAYIQWLSTPGADGKRLAVRGFGAIDQRLEPDPANGRAVFALRCASCHGAQGLGTRAASGYTVPPLWGQDSFNDGAGMARTYTAAAFVKHNMPLGKGDTLSDQDAVDVADYFTHQNRPYFAGKTNDWPKGDKPRDARN